MYISRLSTPPSSYLVYTLHKARNSTHTTYTYTVFVHNRVHASNHVPEWRALSAGLLLAGYDVTLTPASHWLRMTALRPIGCHWPAMTMVVWWTIVVFGPLWCHKHVQVNVAHLPPPRHYCFGTLNVGTSPPQKPILPPLLLLYCWDFYNTNITAQQSSCCFTILFECTFGICVIRIIPVFFFC